MDYSILKSLHIIFVVSWFAGLFYLPRLLVYHAEAQSKEPNEKAILSAQFSKMEKLLFNAIMIPAMFLTWITGLILIYLAWWDSFSSHTWLHLKLSFVVGITIYHFVCRHFIRQFQQGNFIISGPQLRMFNEIATILLVAVVFLVVAKNTLDMIYGLVGFVIFAIVIMTAVKIVRKYRTNA
ncbi:CopD family protein [Aquirufa sp.]|jgi:putative membrane protein|uniref:CopD family protein n=1 Tax=Aquirufa sp. TaxID=2676249 RepID=UPI0037BFBFD3